MNRHLGDNRRQKTVAELEDLVQRLAQKNHNRRKALRAMNKTLQAQFYVNSAHNTQFALLHSKIARLEAQVSDLEDELEDCRGS